MATLRDKYWIVSVEVSGKRVPYSYEYPGWDVPSTVLYPSRDEAMQAACKLPVISLPQVEELRLAVFGSEGLSSIANWLETMSAQNETPAQ